MGMKRLTPALILVPVLILAACTRNATPSGPGAQDLPFPTPGSTSEFPAMDILSTAAAATQTAQAQPPGGEQPAATESPTEAAPAATATPEPTATTAPTQAGDDAGDATACASPYTVAEGEWVYSIARKCGLDPNDIIAENNLRAPFLLYPGDQLNLPGGGGGTDPTPTNGTTTCSSPYMVKLGEWVYSIARKCGSTAEAIISANNLSFPYTIFPGDELIIP